VAANNSFSRDVPLPFCMLSSFPLLQMRTLGPSVPDQTCL
jgi:hypothetical protein